MGGDGVYAKDIGRIPSLGGKSDHRDDGNMWVRQGVGIPPVGGGNGRHRTSYHRRVYQEATGDHSVKGGLKTHL